MSGNIAIDGYGQGGSVIPNVPTVGYGIGVDLGGRLIDRYTFGPVPLDSQSRAGRRGGLGLSTSPRRRR